MTVNQCACQNFFFGTYGEDGSAESFEDYGTGCQATTARVFAQGHDAKLVGFLVRADLAGEEIATTQGGMRVTFQNAIHAAGSISEALAAKADAQLNAAAARLAAKADKPAKKAKSRTEVARAVEAKVIPTTRNAKIKVGRWTYDAEIDNTTGTATFTRTMGGKRDVQIGQYTEVA